MDQEPPQNATAQQQQHYELIIETGFFVYFLISKYLDLDSQDMDSETSYELMEIKNVVNNQDSLFSKKNLLGQLGNFAFALIGGIVSTMHTVVKSIHKKLIKQNNNDKMKERELRQEKDKMEERLIFQQAYIFFAQNSAHIQIVRNGQIQKVLFPLLPFCHYISKETQNEFNDNVCRDSPHSKITCLIEEAPKIIEICKHQQDLANFFNRNKILSIFANFVDLWKDIAFTLTILINIFIIVSFRGDSTNSEQSRMQEPVLVLGGNREQYTEIATNQLFTVCGLIMIVCSTFVVTFFLCKKAPLYLKQAWKANQGFLQKKTGFFLQTIRYSMVVLFSVLRVLMNVEVAYYLTYAVLAFIATFVHPFFFAFHLTEFLVRYATLRNILKSVWEPKTALLLTFVLIIIIIYFITIMGYVFFESSYAGRCESLLFCVFETFQHTFQSNGGLGGWLINNKPQDPNRYDFARFFFDNFVNIAIVIVMIQMFSGIIIDKFGHLRQKQINKLKDIMEICFMCGFTREIFDRKSDCGFNHHIQQEHYLWNYLFYIAYLKEQDSTEYTGVESHVDECMKNYDNSWVPIGQASSLKLNDVIQKEIQFNSIVDLKNQVKQLLKKKSFVLNCVQLLDDSTQQKRIIDQQ